MDQTTINRYQQFNQDTGDVGDIYASLQSSYGTDTANNIANIAMDTGDETQINAAIVKAKYGAPLPTSTAGQLYTQLTTDPLAAPLASANNVLGNTFLSFIKNPWVLVTIAAAVFFFVFDGLNVLKGMAKSK